MVDDYETVESVKKLEETWLDFYYYTIDLTAANLSYISNYYIEQFPKLPEDSQDLVVAKALQIHRNDPVFDSRPVIQLIMKVKGLRSPFQLLHEERLKIIN